MQLISTLLLLLLLGVSHASISGSSEIPLASYSPLLRSSQSAQSLQQAAHTITPLTIGTRAHCNISPPNSDEINVHPCVVADVNIRESSGLILYEVSYLNNDELVSETLPFTRVQRRNLR